jgi:hypothetical protein
MFVCGINTVLRHLPRLISILPFRQAFFPTTPSPSNADGAGCEWPFTHIGVQKNLSPLQISRPFKSLAPSNLAPLQIWRPFTG